MAFPDAKLTLLVNKVAEDVVLNNPHIDSLHVYKKAKHRSKNETAIGVYLHRLKIFWALRKTHFDAAVLANPVPCKYSLRLARMAGATHIISAGEPNYGLKRNFGREDFSGNHQVEHTYSYLSAPAFVHHLLEDVHARVLIFWSPQGALGPDDMGDAARAEKLLALVGSSRVAAYPTTSVRDLMAGFNCCDQILCSDGGQMHIAAGLHKKQVVFFGDTDAPGWHPWSGEYKILLTPSGECKDVTLGSVIDEWHQLKGATEDNVA